mmetsp:Transcript_9310/g.17165  ORF Transcript_9310/g.17165 Transcript_9310/m.17165 type:complete len:408 (-) Transcript_9310:151-1374(-)
MASDRAELLRDSSLSKTVTPGKEADSDSDSEEIDDAPQHCSWCARRARQFGSKEPVKWLVPAFLVALSSILCMWMLHLATFYYVQGIIRFEKAYAPQEHKENHPGLFSNGLREDEVSFGSLQDPLEAQLGFQEVPLKALDAVALVFPSLWFLTVLYLWDVQQWTKCLLCHSVLAIGKGVFGAVTIIPDSIGWDQCKKRLGKSGLEFFMHEVPDPTKHGMWTTSMAILGVELAGPHQNRIGAGMRFCADMLYSGHTYFTILYILALCELVPKALRNPDSGLYVKNERKRRLILVLLYIFCIMQQCIEICLVLQNRFHYTSDVALAVLLTFLWYTSAPICIAAKWWAQLGKDPLPQAFDPKDMVLIPAQVLQADVWLPMFCLPFCCLMGSHHVISGRDVNSWQADGKNV